MIRVALFDRSTDSTRLGEIEYSKIPVEGDGDFRCVPHDVACCMRCVRGIAEDLHQGLTHGITCRHMWYRQAGGSL